MKVKLNNPDFYSAFCFFQQIGKLSKFTIKNNRVKANFDEKYDDLVHLKLDFSENKRLINFPGLYTYLSNFGKIEYLKVDKFVAYVRFETVQSNIDVFERMTKTKNRTIVVKPSFIRINFKQC